MPRKAIFTDVMTVLEQRIAQGDYMLKDLPGERRIAQEVGVSYMTARKAVQKLIDKNVLARRPNGSLAVHAKINNPRATCNVVLLTPAYPSPHFARCRQAVTLAAKARHALIRCVEYVHWHDPVVLQALHASDGLIVIPSTEPIPRHILTAFARPEHRVIFFDDDMSSEGFPSVQLFARSHIAVLFEHLWSLGHRRIDCLNAQGHNHEIANRIAHWQQWINDRGGEGTLWDNPAPAFEDPTAIAHATMQRLLSNPPHKLSAIVCTTQPAALGAMRACFETGRSVGQDISICTINNEPTGRFFCPSLTGLEMPDIAPLLDRCFDWIAKPDQPWQGNLRIVPEHPNLLQGESTGKPATA